MAFRTTRNNLDAEANASAEVQQSTAILPLQYDSLVALVDLSRRASHSPLFMCIPLFAHAAFSEVQFLNLMESRIQIQIDAIIQDAPADALETLQYFSTVLDRHAHQLSDSTRALRKLNEVDRQGMNEAQMEGQLLRYSLLDAGKTKFMGNSSDGPFSPKGLLGDYDELYMRCIDLSKLCTRGITLAMNKATIEESRKAIEQSKRLKKLTLLATLFIPLTFSSSLLGMNVDLLGQNAVRFWWFFVLCVPITVFACAFYFWDLMALRQLWIMTWRRWRAIRQNTTAGDDKDPSYTV